MTNKNEPKKTLEDHKIAFEKEFGKLMKAFGGVDTQENHDDLEIRMVRVLNAIIKLNKIMENDDKKNKPKP